MKRRTQIILMLCLALALLTTGVVFAAAPALRTSSVLGGGSGGGVGTSANYRLEGSAGSAILVSASSANYGLCSGFVCVGAEFPVFMPSLQRD